MFNTIPAADLSAFSAPVKKLIELNTATMNKAFEAQKAAAEKQLAQSHANFKAVMAIKDTKALTSFVTEQSELAKANLETLKAEAQVAADNAKAYFAEVQAIMTESKDAVVKAATPKKA